jgi:hypothetical protein
MSLKPVCDIPGTVHSAALGTVPCRQLKAKSDTEKEPSEPLQAAHTDNLKSNPTLQGLS